MARDFHELVRERMERESEFAAGLYQDCIDLLQSNDVEDRAVGESMLSHYFDAEAGSAARRLAATAAPAVTGNAAD